MCPLFFIKLVFFHQMIAPPELWKVFFISLKKLFSFSKYSNFCNLFPVPHFPDKKGQMEVEWFVMSWTGLHKFTKINRGSGTSFWCTFSVWFFHENVFYLILYQQTKFQCHTSFPLQDIKQNVLLSSYLDSWWWHKL